MFFYLHFFVMVGLAASVYLLGRSVLEVSGTDYDCLVLERAVWGAFRPSSTVRLGRAGTFWGRLWQSATVCNYRRES